MFSACRGVISVCTMLPLLRVAAEAKSDSTLGHWTCWNEVTVLCCNCQMPGSRKRPVRLDVVVPVCGITWRALWVQRLWVPQTWTQIPGDGKGTTKLQNLRYRSLHLLSCCPAPPCPAPPRRTPTPPPPSHRKSFWPLRFGFILQLHKTYLI